MHRQVGEDLPVDHDLVLVQPCDQLGIRRSVEAGARVNARDPEAAVFAFLRPAMTVGMRQGLLDMVLGNGEDLASSAPVSFRLAEKLLSPPV